MTDTGTFIRIKAADGFDTEAYCIVPEGATAAVICVMEAFGVNDHICRVADDYAAQGYAVLAPALYDRLGRGFIFRYQEDLPQAVASMRSNGFDNPLADIAGCVAWFRQRGIGRIGIVGYCYGGTVSWLAASRNPDISAASCYYGSAIPAFPDDHPRCPTIAHWGRSDPTTPADKVEVVASTNPDVAMYWYNTGHGFNSDDREGSYDAVAAREARERTLEFFQQQLGG